MRCPQCNSSPLIFIRPMTNVNKYWCRRCRKVVHLPKGEELQPGDYASTQMEDGQIGYFVYDHQNKAKKIIEALNGGRFFRLECNDHFKGVRFVLTDTDILGRRYALERIRSKKVSLFFVYPHAARPNLVNDIHQEWPYVTAHFVVSEGHADVMRSFGYSRPLVPIGWSLCPQREFQPRPIARNVLFAPIHPRCSKVDQDANRAAFQRLEKLAKNGDIILTVRFIRSLPDSGLERVDHPNIIYTNGHMNQAYDQIDNSDIVIAHQTFLYLAVARGVPSIGMAEAMPTHIQIKGKPVQWVKHWKKYADMIRFPYDILDCTTSNEVLNMLNEAVAGNGKIYDWRKRMIGRPFRKDRFIAKLEAYL